MLLAYAPPSPPGNIYTIGSGSVQLAAGATQTLILLTPMRNSVVPKDISISFDGGALAAGIGVELYRTTTLGAPAGTPFTPAPTKLAQPASATSALVNLSVEPTAIVVLWGWFLQQAAGPLEFPQVIQQELLAASLQDAASIGMRVVTPAGVSPHARADWQFIES